MMNTAKCLKIANKPDRSTIDVILIGDCYFALQDATAKEVERGNAALEGWRVERQYQVQVCGPDSPKPYFDWRRETVTIPFDELIFLGGDCIGVCHEGCVMLFDDEKTHRQKKWIGEFVTGPDRGIDVYDYYELIKNTSV